MDVEMLYPCPSLSYVTATKNVEAEGDAPAISEPMVSVYTVRCSQGSRVDTLLLCI